jgi:hypothetical protein
MLPTPLRAPHLPFKEIWSEGPWPQEAFDSSLSQPLPKSVPFSVNTWAPQELELEPGIHPGAVSRQICVAPVLPASMESSGTEVHLQARREWGKEAGGGSHAAG